MELTEGVTVILRIPENVYHPWLNVWKKNMPAATFGRCSLNIHYEQSNYLTFVRHEPPACGDQAMLSNQASNSD